MIHGCPYLPGDARIQSGLRPDSEVIIMISLKELLRNNIRVWRSANDIVMTSGAQGRIPVSMFVQIIGVKNVQKYKYDRSGQVWLNNTYVDPGRGNLQGSSVSDWDYEIKGDATSLKSSNHNRGWFTPETPFNIKLLAEDRGSQPSTYDDRAGADPPTRHETVLMMQEAPAGQPAGGSDGSWVHATDMSGLTSNGGDGLFAMGPWRPQAQQLPTPAGQPATYHPQSGATTPRRGARTVWRQGARTVCMIDCTS